MPKEFSRNQRLSSQMLRILNELIRFETKDPAVSGVSLTAIELSRDLSVATVFFSLLDPDDAPESALQGLQRAAGFLRSKLGASIKVRHTPELRFIHDDSVAHSIKISQLIESAKITTDTDGSR
jgi:ribosome-binding factor A